MKRRYGPCGRAVTQSGERRIRSWECAVDCAQRNGTTEVTGEHWQRRGSLCRATVICPTPNFVASRLNGPDRPYNHVHTATLKEIYIHRTILTPKSNASQCATQQARPRLMSGAPTLFVFRSEIERDRVYTVALVGCTKPVPGSVISQERMDRERGPLGVL